LRLCLRFGRSLQLPRPVAGALPLVLCVDGPLRLTLRLSRRLRLSLDRTGRGRRGRTSVGCRSQADENLPHQGELFADVGNLPCRHVGSRLRAGTQPSRVGRRRVGDQLRLLPGRRLQ
jgi:hypothetical protein